MALTRWDPFTTLSRLDEDFDQLVRRAWAGPAREGGRSRSATAGYVPAIDMRVDGSDVVITLELPGVDVAKDVDIEVSDGRLTISGERQDRTERHLEDGRVLVRELRYGSFRREFALPDGVTADHVEASYDQGMLEVRVREVTKPEVPPQKVAIRTTDQRQTIEGSSEPSEG